MWQSDLATSGSVLHSTDSLPTPTEDAPSMHLNDESPGISPGHCCKRGGGPTASLARKHSVHEHKFDQEKVPLVYLEH